MNFIFLKEDAKLKLVEKVEILRYSGGKLSSVMDPMVHEYHLALHVGGEHQVNLYCSPTEFEELVLGYLFCEGIISNLSEVEHFTVNEISGTADVWLRKEVYNREVMADVRFKKEALLKNLAQFYEDSTIHKATAGVHRCALCDDNCILLACIDISRHNAFDKTIGKALKSGLSMNDKYIITSGRVPRDMVMKAIIAEVPMLVSRSAPTIEAVEIAKQKGLTLLGFSREDRFNVYCGAEKLDL